MIGRLLHKTDFERLLAVARCSGSAHFAVHCLLGRPTLSTRAGTAKLSTDGTPNRVESVDDRVPRQWLGCVIPKRHARRAVTRNLLRRQIRAVMERHAEQLQPGLWLVRLRRPFAPAEFRSADSARLRVAARTELDSVFRRLKTAPAG